MPLQRISRLLVLVVAFLIVVASITCKEETVSSPTAPGGATIQGTVVSGDTGESLRGVTVRVLRSGQAALTDGSGNFTLAAVPAGEQDLQFSRSDIDARGSVAVTSGANVSIIATILKRTTVVIAPRGSPNAPATATPTGTITPPVTATPGGGPAIAEIEGIVTGVGGSTITVFDERLGSVTANVTTSTVIRKGQTPLTLAQIQIGWRVHIKATQSGGVLTATEIIVQDQNVQATATATSAATGTPTPTSTGVPATATATATSVPATSTPTPSATTTATSVPATSTPTLSATATATSVTATHTVTPTRTATPTPTTTP